jgi:hypothetical protein
MKKLSFVIIAMFILLLSCEEAEGLPGTKGAEEETVDPVYKVEAAAYRAEYADTLALTVDGVTAGDESAVNAAKTAYKALSAFAKSLCISDKNLLNSLLTKIDAIKAIPYTIHSFDEIAAYLASPPAPYTSAGTTAADPIRLILGPEIEFTKYTLGDEDAVTGNPTDGGNLGMTRYTPLLKDLTKYVDLDLSQCPGLNATYSKTLKSVTIDDANKKYIVVLRLPSYVTTTAVADKASGGSFAFYSSLKKAYLPGVITIGKVAFSGCSNLEEIYAPKLSGLGEQFCASSKLTSITMGKTPPGMENMAFDSLKSLKGLTIHVPYGTSVNDPAKGYLQWYNDKKGTLMPFPVTFVVDEEE